MGKIDGKLQSVCARLAALPCDRHQLENEVRFKDKVSWKVFLLTITAAATLLGTAYMFTYEVEQELHQHTGNIGAHYKMMLPPDYDKDF